MKGKRLSETHRLALWNGSRDGRQTKPEKRVQTIIDFMFSPFVVYQYTGNRKFWVTLKNGKHRNPDFTCSSLGKIIEVFGRYWHRNDDPAQVITQYREVGWDCLIIWDDEVGFSTRDRIMEFTYPYEYEEELRQEI
jgi:hypothetical protein